MGAITQGDLFRSMWRKTDPETSKKAALDHTPEGLSGDRWLVLHCHASLPEGLTDYELAHLLGRQQNSVGKRRGELCKAGLIEKTEITRPAPSGSSAAVWKITEAGKQVASA